MILTDSPCAHESWPKVAEEPCALRARARRSPILAVRARAVGSWVSRTDYNGRRKSCSEMENASG